MAIITVKTADPTNFLHFVCNGVAAEMCNNCQIKFQCLTTDAPTIEVELTAAELLRSKLIPPAVYIAYRLTGIASPDLIRYINMPFSRHDDLVNEYICSCGWQGFVGEAIHGYEPVGRDEVEAVDFCPECYGNEHQMRMIKFP